MTGLFDVPALTFRSNRVYRAAWPFEPEHDVSRVDLTFSNDGGSIMRWMSRAVAVAAVLTPTLASASLAQRRVLRRDGNRSARSGAGVDGGVPHSTAAGRAHDDRPRLVRLRRRCDRRQPVRHRHRVGRRRQMASLGLACGHPRRRLLRAPRWRASARRSAASICPSTCSASWAAPSIRSRRRTRSSRTRSAGLGCSTRTSTSTDTADSTTAATTARRIWALALAVVST